MGIEEQMIPKELYITPAYYNPEKCSRDKAQLQMDAWACWDLYAAGHHSAALDRLLAWTDCQKLVNHEAKLVMTFKGQLFLDVYQRVGVHMPIFEEWVAHVYRPGAYEFYRENNNLGAWGLLGCSLADSILNQPMLPHVHRFYTYIVDATDKDARMKYEIKRTNSGIWYSYFALAPLLRAAQVLDTEHWMLYRPLDWLWQYMKDPDSWPYRPKKGIAGFIQNMMHPHAKELERPRPNDWGGNLYWEAGSIFGRFDWRTWSAGPPFYGVNIFRSSA